MVMGQQHIQALAHVQIKGRDAGRAAEIQLRHLIVPHAIGKLPHANPLGVQHNHAALNEVDAAELFVISRLAGACVPVDVHDHGHLALQLKRLVQQRRNPPTGHGLVF